MRRRLIGLGTCLLASCLVSAQAVQSGLSGEKRRLPANLASPVTREEVRDSVTRLERAIRKVIPGLPKARAADIAGQQPASRDAIVLQLDRLFLVAKPGFRMTPQMAPYEPAAFTVRDPRVKKALEKLVSWGFVASAGPLATSQEVTLGAQDFGDALGFFLARLAELTHTPSSKYSPYMRRE